MTASRKTAGKPSGGRLVSASAFGMHWLNTSTPYPALSFGAARIWNMGVTWADLQPTSTTRFDSSNAGVVRLDGIVDTFLRHHVQPLMTLGMTPSWAAHACQHVRDGQDWGSTTCAPRDISASGAWGTYVRALAQRYAGKIRYFELWNEPSLYNGWNDSIRTLARMQAVASSILHSYGENLLAPSIVFTNGDPSKGMSWLNRFLSQPGGTSFDIFGVHLYPSDSAVAGGYGPEWATRVALADARSVLARHGLSKPIWNTEMNIGRLPAHTGYRDSAQGAAVVARTLILAVSSGVQRTFWYAADDRAWGGTWMESADYRSLTPAGHAEKTAVRLMLGSTAHGCTSTSTGANAWRYVCRFSLANGANMLAVWSTASTWSYRLPDGTTSFYAATGAMHHASGGSVIRVGAAPVYVTGSFAVS